MFFLHLLLFFALTSIAYIVLVLRHRKYWRHRGIAGPPPKLVSGHFPVLSGTHPGIFQVRKWTQQYGSVYGIQFGWQNMLVISDPAMVHEMLVTKFDYFHARLISPMFGDRDSNKWAHLFDSRGARWKRLRAVANPAFSISNLKRIMPTIDDSVKSFVGLLEEARLRGNPIEIHRHFIELTFDVIARVALGQQESMQFRSDKAQFAILSFQRANNTVFDYLCWVFPWLGRNFFHHYIEWTGILRRDPFHLLRGALIQEIRERKAQRERNEEQQQKRAVDFIDLFLEQESEEQIVHKQHGTFNKATHSVTKTNTLEEITMQLILFLLAGFDTTANSLSVACHNLANHPNVQHQMQKEIDAICVDEDPTYEQLNQLKYTEAVIKETLRLCPVAASVVNRVCAKTTTLGNCTVEEGTAIQVDSISLHRNKELWGDDVEQFRPERWLEEPKLPPYYAFGSGPRICIGLRLALLEEKLALTRLLRNYSIICCPETEKELPFTGQIILNPTTVTVGLKLREED